jgi:hypothetical protein
MNGAPKHVEKLGVLSLELHADDVRARTGFTHGQGAHMLTADELGQKLLLLLRIAVALDLVDAEVGVSAVTQTHGC